MTGQVNRLANGLLDELGIKSGGRFPSGFGDIVAPTLDLLPWYRSTYATEFKTATVAPTVTAGISFTSLTPPVGKCWLVLGAWFTAVAQAGDSMQFCGMISNGDIGSVGNILMLSERASGAITSAIRGAVPFIAPNAQPFILGPGMMMGAFVQQLTLVISVTITCGLSIQELQT